MVMVFVGVTNFVNGVGSQNGASSQNVDETFLRFGALNASVQTITSSFRKITVESQNIFDLTINSITEIPKIVKGLLDMALSVPETIRDIMVIYLKIPSVLANIVVILLTLSIVASLVFLLYKAWPQPTKQ